MKVALTTRDGRLMARIINLAYRFGCSYTGVSAHLLDDAYIATIELHGPADALRRLRQQVDKLLNEDKEYLA